jgi:hypothetical protein
VRLAPQALLRSERGLSGAIAEESRVLRHELGSLDGEVATVLREVQLERGRQQLARMEVERLGGRREGGRSDLQQVDSTLLDSLSRLHYPSVCTP